MTRKFLAFFACFATMSFSHAGITPEEIDEAAAAVQPQVVEWRRWFHQNPELSNREFNTSAKIAEILQDMGLAPQTGIAHTGLPFASTACSEYNGQEVGVMHACGHDAHMSIGEAAGAGIEFEINRGVKAYGHMVVDFLKSQ